MTQLFRKLPDLTDEEIYNLWGILHHIEEVPEKPEMIPIAQGLSDKFRPLANKIEYSVARDVVKKVLDGS